MKNSVVSTLISQYFNDYLNVVLEQLKLTEDDGRNWLKDETFCKIIEDDLNDKGFSNIEIQEILEQDMHKDTTYHLVAYILKLFDDYSNINELKNIITDDADLDINDFTEEDLNTILNYSMRLT